MVEGQGSEPFHNENIAILWICLWSWFNNIVSPILPEVVVVLVFLVDDILNN